MTASLSAVSTTFAGERRAWAIGMWSAIGSTAAAAAPVVGGLVVDGLGWRWFFALNVPVAARGAGDDRAGRPRDLRRPPADRPRRCGARHGLGHAGGLRVPGGGHPRVARAARCSVRIGLGALRFGAFVVQQRRAPHPLIERRHHARPCLPPTGGGRVPRQLGFRCHQHPADLLAPGRA